MHYEKYADGTVKCIEDEIPFDLPESWAWCRIKNICTIGTGATPLKSNSVYYANGTIPWITSAATSEEIITTPADYITERAIAETNCSIYPIGTLIIAMYFSSFLHHFEKRLNGVIYRFLSRSGYDRYDPARFLDYKLEVLQMLLFCLPRFDPVQETEFLKYAKHYIQDGLLFCRMMGEAGSFASLAEYRRVRKIGAIYNDSGKNRAEVVSEFAVQSGYMDESVSADELLTIAQRNRSIVSLYRTEQDEDGEWGEIRFDFENDTAEIVRLADWDTVKSNIFANTAIRFVQRLPEARLLKSVVVPFEMERLDLI